MCVTQLMGVRVCVAANFEYMSLHFMILKYYEYVTER